jgi:dephospho-CoA kinase
MDYTVVVTAPEAVRIARVMQRDGLSEAQVRQRIAAQWGDEARLAQADFVLENDNCQALLPAVLEIIDKIKRRWKRQI